MDNKKCKKTKTAMVLEHLQKHGSITSLEAFEKYRITRLAAIIYVLRQSHIIMSSERETVDGGVYAKYTYNGEMPKAN